MPGPPPKDPDRRQGHRSKGRLVLMGADPVIPVEFRPPPRRDWLKATRDAWLELWASPLAPLYVSTDQPALRRLFEMVDDRARYRLAVRKCPLVEGSQGQMVANPLARLIGPLSVEIRQMEDRFGLSQMSRLRMGIKLGQAARSLDDLWSNADPDDGEDDPDPRTKA